VLALALRRAGADPVPFLQRALEAHPGDFWLHLALAGELRRQRHPAQAATHAQVALVLRPGSQGARELLARTLLDGGRPARAAAEFRRLLSVKPASGVYRLLTDALAAAGDLDGAENAMREGQRLFGEAAGDADRLEAIRKKRAAAAKP
jgi:predicted Zn-dependent protease